MQIRNQIKTTIPLAAAMGALALTATSAQAVLTQIGAGADLAGSFVQDTPGGNYLVVADTSPGDDFVNLAAGTYSVRDFQLNVFNHTEGTAGAGTVAPLLLTKVGAGSFSTLWVGDDFDPTSDGVQTAASYAAGVETFTLAAATDVYAGFFNTNGGSGIVSLITSTGTADVDISITAPTGPGESVTGFSHPSGSLTRAYAFEVNVEPVPEPSTSALLGLGGLALILRRRK